MATRWEPALAGATCPISTTLTGRHRETYATSTTPFCTSTTRSAVCRGFLSVVIFHLCSAWEPAPTDFGLTRSRPCNVVHDHPRSRPPRIRARRAYNVGIVVVVVVVVVVVIGDRSSWRRNVFSRASAA